jgi:cytochrome oxidase Cu insertion factor (SCO1/SenC/PrrC family)
MPGHPRIAALLMAATIACTTFGLAGLAHAQNPAAAAQAPAISGTTLENKAFQLASRRGKVVLVMFWSTDCAVCRDKMPELRENALGWADKPFELVLVSVDPRMDDVKSYNTIINQTVPANQRLTQLWAGDGTYQDNLGLSKLARRQLPVSLLIDKQGKLVERYNGRIPVQVWDTISDLL